MAATPLPRLRLTRIATGDAGTFGVLAPPTAGRRNWRTGELPWRDNDMGCSCIPVGLYHCPPRYTEARGHHFEVRGVPNRSQVLIHGGNWCGDIGKGLRSDVRGCILPGESVGSLAGQAAVIDSRTALAELVALAPDGLELEIVDATPGLIAGGRWHAPAATG